MENPYAKYAQPQQGPISSGFKPVDEFKPRADARDQTRLDLAIAQFEQGQAEKAEEKRSKAEEEARSKAAMLARLKSDAKNIARLGKDANDNSGFGETGTSGSLSRAILPAGTAGYSLGADIETFKAKNAFAGLSELAAQGIKLTPVSNEEIKLAAASIANLDPNADHETFMRAVGETKQYYYDAIARIDPLEAYQVALDNGEDVESIIAIAERNDGPMPDRNILEQAVQFTAGGGKGASFKPPEPPTDGGGGLGQAFYAGVGDVAQGVGDTLGLIGNPLNAGINAIAGTNLSTDLGQTFRDATGAPQGDPMASAINRGGTAALTMTGAASAARPFVQGAAQGVTNALASQPAQQFVGGMTAGGASEGARQAGAPPLVQAGAGILGGVLGFGGANAMMSGVEAARAAPNALAPTSSRLIPNAQQVVNTGKASGVRVMTSDIRPPSSRTAKISRNVGDSIPIAGTAGPRAAQQTERVEAVQKLMKEFGADDGAIEAVSKDLVKTRGATIGRLTEAKKSVIENIKGAVPAPKAIAEIDKQIAKLSGIDDTAFKPVIDRLNGFKTALQSGKSLEQVEGQRKLLGDLFSDPLLASIKGDGQKAINAIYDPLRQDMGAFIEAAGGPAAKAKWAGANERLAAMAGELDASAFKNLLNNAETTPESAAKILFGKTPSDMKRLYGSLSEKGRTKAQSAIMFQALEKSTSNDMISPQKFAAAMEAMSKATGVFFSPADKARIDGITRLLKATQHASEAAANPMTGAQNTPLIAGLSIGQIFGTAALPATAGAGLLARAYESAPVRDAFIRLSKTKPGSPQESAMFSKVSAALIAANENNSQTLANAPGLSQAAASDQVSEKRPIQP